MSISVRLIPPVLEGEAIDEITSKNIFCLLAFHFGFSQEQMEGLCMFAEPFCLENDGLLDEDPNCNFAYYARSFIESIKSNIENDIKILHYCHGTHIAKILIISALKSLRERDILKSNLRDSILTGKKAYWNKMKVYLLYNEYAELEKAFVCNKSLIQYRADWETRILILES